MTVQSPVIIMVVAVALACMQVGARANEAPLEMVFIPGC